MLDLMSVGVARRPILDRSICRSASRALVGARANFQTSVRKHVAKSRVPTKPCREHPWRVSCVRKHDLLSVEFGHRLLPDVLACIGFSCITLGNADAMLTDRRTSNGSYRSSSRDTISWLISGACKYELLSWVLGRHILTSLTLRRLGHIRLYKAL